MASESHIHQSKKEDTTGVWQRQNYTFWNMIKLPQEHLDKRLHISEQGPLHAAHRLCQLASSARILTSPAFTAQDQDGRSGLAPLATVPKLQQRQTQVPCW